MSNIPGNFTDGTVTGTDDGGHSASLVMGLPLRTPTTAPCAW